jgi:hypothetical protein
MSDGGNEDGDDLDFYYAPQRPLTPEQRIEVLESQVAELRKQIGALLDQLPWLAASHKN